MKKKRGRRIAMLLAIMMLIMNLIVSPVWAAPGVAIDETNFPDYNFRTYVSTKLDTDGDGKLSDTEIAGVTSIDVRHKRVEDLTGIEYFTALVYLNFDGSQLSTLDISKNTALQKLYCEVNQLSTLDISNNPALETLSCGLNQLTNLDVSNNPALKVLYCWGNKLTSLDISKNTALQDLYCVANKLTNLDVSKNSALQDLDCSSNQLTSLDVSNNPALVKLNCSYNQLSTLDVSKNPALEELSCHETQLSTLDISKNRKLQTLYCSKNQLTSLDISKNPALVDLACYSNQLTNLDLSNNPALQHLECSANQLTSLDASNKPTLVKLNCSDNQLSTLDISKNPALQELWCSDNQLSTLDISKNPALVDLICRRNQLTSLDISKNPALQTLWCYNNQLTSLDLSNNTQISDFDGDNQTYDVKVKTSDMKIVYTDFPSNFDITKAKNIVGADSNFIVDATKPSKVTYYYNTGTGGYINVTLNITYIYTVTFNTNGGSAVASQTITAGGKVTKPADPTKDGYTFAGWYKEAEFTTAFDFANETINADTTIYAKWNQNAPPTPVTYTLTASVDGGHGSVTPTSKTVNKDETVTLTFAPETGYEIEEVKVNDVATTVSGNTLTLTMDGDKTVVVKYKATLTPPPTPVTYTLTASVDGGHGSVTPTSKTVNKDETVTLTFAPETGYEIEEVKVNGTVTPVSGNSLVLTMDGDKAVVVKYKQKSVTPPPAPTQFTITFEANGGGGTMPVVTKNKDEKYALPDCGFTPPTGKEFKAWQVGGVEKNIGDEITVDGDKTVTAVWKDKGSVPPTPPVPPTPTPEPTPTPSPAPYPIPWIIYPSWYYAYETPEPKEEKPVEIDRKIVLTIGSYAMDRELNGISTDIMMDVAPYIKERRTMLPVRYVAEALGFDVEWIRSTRTVILKEGSSRVEIPVDTNQIIVNGKVYTSDVKPEIKNNRTMLSIANIARALGLKDGKDIIWNSKSKMVTIYRSIVVE